jgi:hypothetical protein
MSVPRMGWVRRGGTAGLAALAVGAGVAAGPFTSASSPTLAVNPAPVSIYAAVNIAGDAPDSAALSKTCIDFTVTLVPGFLALKQVSAAIAPPFSNPRSSGWLPQNVSKRFLLAQSGTLTGQQPLVPLTKTTIPGQGVGFTQPFCHPVILKSPGLQTFNLVIKGPGFPLNGASGAMGVQLSIMPNSGGHCAACYGVIFPKPTSQLIFR